MVTAVEVKVVVVVVEGCWYVARATPVPRAACLRRRVKRRRSRAVAAALSCPRMQPGSTTLHQEVEKE